MPEMRTTHPPRMGNDRRTRHLLHTYAHRQVEGRRQVPRLPQLRPDRTVPQLRRHPHRRRHTHHRQWLPRTRQGNHPIPHRRRRRLHQLRQSALCVCVDEAFCVSVFVCVFVDATHRFSTTNRHSREYSNEWRFL